MAVATRITPDGGLVKMARAICCTAAASNAGAGIFLLPLRLSLPKSSLEKATSVPAKALLQRRCGRAGVVLARAFAPEALPTSDTDRAWKTGWCCYF